MKLTLLVTCVGGELVPEVLQILKGSTRHDIRLVGVDMRDVAVGRHFCDAFSTVPRGDDPSYTDVIMDIAERHGVDLLYPTSDEEAVSLASVEALLTRRGLRLASNKSNIVDVVSDKIATYRRLDKAGIATPLWREARTIDELEPLLSDVLGETGSAVVKPSRARGGRGVFVLQAGDAAAEHYRGGREAHVGLDTFLRKHAVELRDLCPLLVMERLAEPVYDVDMLGWEGKAERVVVRQRLNPAGIPNEGNIIVDDPGLRSLGGEIVESLGSSWLLDCDVMSDSRGRPRVLEINPRPSGSVAASIRAGVPLLDDMISLCYGEPIEDVPYPAGRMVVPYKGLAKVEQHLRDW